MTKNYLICVSALFVALVLGMAASGGTLRIGVPIVEGELVSIPVSVDGDVGPGAAALNFDLKYDADIFEPVRVETGSAASAAGKEVQSNMIAPGDYRVLMTGFNQDVVSSGEVATIVMRRIGEPEGGRSNIRVTGTTLASADAVEIPSTGSSGVVQLGNGEVDEPAPEETPEVAQPQETASADDVEPPSPLPTSSTATREGDTAASPMKRPGAPGGVAPSSTRNADAENARARTELSAAVDEARSKREALRPGTPRSNANGESAVSANVPGVPSQTAVDDSAEPSEGSVSRTTASTAAIDTVPAPGRAADTVESSDSAARSEEVSEDAAQGGTSSAYGLILPIIVAVVVLAGLFVVRKVLFT